MPKRPGSDSDYDSPRSKRPRRSVDLSELSPDEDPDASEDEIRPVVRRRRIQRHDSDDEIRADEASEDEIRPVTRPRANGTQGAVVDDADDEDDGAGSDMEEDEDDEDEEQVADQVRLSVENGFAHSGILHSVKLDRFMSHNCFEYPLGPNVNIVNGPNGSGKSAIVAALQIGLLGSVNVTERAKKLEDFIMHGRDNCVITIKLLNRKPPETDNGFSEPDLTYKHDVYGDLITIERRLFRGGRGNSFSVKARNRHVKLPKGTTPRQEVQAIVDHFGFMVDNPVAILTQTKAKEFLSKGKGTDQYRLYRRATLLGPLEDELSKTRSVTLEVQDMLRRKEECRPQVEEDLRKKEAAHQEAQEMKNIDVLIRQAETKFAWTIVQEEELVLQKNETRTTNEFEPKAERARMAYENSQKKIASLKEEAKTHSDALNAASERSRVLALSSREAQRSKKEIQMDIAHHKRKIQEFEAETASLQENIARTKAKMERARETHFAGQEQKSRMLHELQGIDAEVEEITGKMTADRRRESALHEKTLGIQDEKRQASSETERLKREFEGKRREHMQAESFARNKDSVARFGGTVPSICRSIRENERRFHRKPIGPIGQYVKMRDESWAPTVEIAIGRHTLRTFIVHDSHDASLLERFIPREGQRPTILISNVDRDRYNIRRDDMPDVASYGHRTILETIDIEHNAVFNYLVDQGQIERNVLNGTDHDITELGWSRLPNLHTVWNKRCERAYTRNGSNTFRKGPRQINAQMLSKDMRPYLQSLQEEINSINREMSDSIARTREKETELKEIAAEVRAVRRKVAQFENAISELQRKKASLEDQLNRAENAFDPAPFEQDISSFEESIREQEAQKAASVAQVQTLEESRDRIASEAEEATSALREANSATKKAKKSLEEVHDNLARLKSRDRQLKRDHDLSAATVAKAHEELDKQRNKIAGFMEQAMAFGNCPEDVDPAKKSSTECSLSMECLKKKLETEQERRGGRTAQEIEVDYLRAKRKDEENREVLARIRYYVKALNRGIKSRHAKLSHLNRTLKKMVRANFRKFLSPRGHVGNIVFKTVNGEKELHIVMKMASHMKGDGERHETKDVRGLSGGEKSYTTLCFILALAEICQNPVRIMDEIDVFQDESNRHASYKTITQFFTKYLSNRQIIIITPLTLPSMNSTPALRIVKLDPPRKESSRGLQTNLDQYIPRE